MSDKEEGEIIDDDFEDISDNSIIEPCAPTGKSVSPKDNLRAFSLSSLTDFEDDKKIEENNKECRVLKRTVVISESKRRRPSKHCSRKRKRIHRRPSRVLECSDSDNEMELDRRLQQQLKAAIRVDGEEAHRNSLRTRLKAMTKTPLNEPEAVALPLELNVTNVTTITCNEMLEDNLETKAIEETNDDDTELIQLRLEALRTAVVNKFKDRKKRKTNEAEDSETNKENNNSSQDEKNKNLAVETKVLESTNTPNNKDNNETTVEDDEDVLRANLLASMSRKLMTIKKPPEEKQNSVTSNPKNKPAHINDNVKTVKNNINSNNFKVNRLANTNKLVRNINNNKFLSVPKVKPFIIRVTNDSDSEDDSVKIVTVTKKPEPASVPISTGIENTVDKFLREQRAKVEAEVKTVPANAAQVTLNTLKNSPVIKPKKSLVMEKSAVKLLPKSKQIEYQKLLLKLKNAEKRPCVRKNSHRVVETKVISSITKTKLLNKSKVVVDKLANAKLNKNLEIRAETPQETVLLRRTFNDLHIVVNNRFQIRDRYKVLRPLIKHVNEASRERKKCENEVKRLLEELDKAKKSQVTSQKAFTMSVKELIAKKEEIDQRCSTPVSEVVVTKNHFTSTPIKEKASVSTLEISSIPDNSLEVPSNMPTITETPGDVNIGDPNDIDKIINKGKNAFGQITKSTDTPDGFLKYISPLDIVKSAETSDPFSILCPFEVDGTCKDNECTYKHFFKR